MKREERRGIIARSASRDPKGLAASFEAFGVALAELGDQVRWGRTEREWQRRADASRLRSAERRRKRRRRALALRLAVDALGLLVLLAALAAAGYLLLR